MSDLWNSRKKKETTSVTHLTEHIHQPAVNPAVSRNHTVPGVLYTHRKRTASQFNIYALQ